MPDESVANSSPPCNGTLVDSHVNSPVHSGRQRLPGPPAGLRHRRPALGSGSPGPRAEAIRWLSRDGAAATVLRDAFAQAWQVTADCCLACSPQCREAGGVNGAGVCVTERDIARYGDASPDLMYCADVLVDAFADARIVQIIRDGRDVVAAMLADPEVLAWFKPGVANVESEFPNLFFGIETETDLAAWPGLSLAGKCAMRWRGSVRKMARLRSSMGAEQLTTLRYEQLIRQPDAAARATSDFVGGPVVPVAVRGRFRWPKGGQPLA